MRTRDPRAPYKPRCPEDARLIPLTQGQWAIVDEDRYEWAMQWKWCALWNLKTKSYYAVRNETIAEWGSRKRRKFVFMHGQYWV